MPKGRPASSSRPALGERIARARLAAGLTQEQLAAAMHVTQRVVTYWEREARSVRTDQLVRLADVLETSVDALLETERHRDKQIPPVLEKLESLPSRRRREILKAMEALMAKSPRRRRT